MCGELEVSLGGRRSALAGRPVVGLVPIVVLGLVHLERLDKLAVVERPSAVVGEAGGEEGVHLRATRGKSDPKETRERRQVTLRGAEQARAHLVIRQPVPRRLEPLAQLVDPYEAFVARIKARKRLANDVVLVHPKQLVAHHRQELGEAQLPLRLLAGACGWRREEGREVGVARRKAEVGERRREVGDRDEPVAVDVDQVEGFPELLNLRGREERVEGGRSLAGVAARGARSEGGATTRAGQPVAQLVRSGSATSVSGEELCGDLNLELPVLTEHGQP